MIIIIINYIIGGTITNKMIVKLTICFFLPVTNFIRKTNYYEQRKKYKKIKLLFLI